MSAFIVCGADNCGKDTLIKNIQNYLYSFHPDIVIPVQTLYYSNFKTDPEHVETISRIHYREGFQTICKAKPEAKHIIFNRFHLGEYVYSPLYRGYDGSYVFELEKQYKSHLNDVILILLTDTAENSLKRDDGLSLTTDLDKRRIEIERFDEAFKMSIIKNKIRIDINGLSIEDVKQKAIDFIRMTRSK